MFGQPGGTPQFFDKVHNQKVCLETAFMDGVTTIAGVVRVLNIAFHKSVTVRWTVNDWSTVTEQQAEYVPGSSVGNTDKFRFRLVCGALPVGSRVQLCLKYSCAGEHWDSNGGANYVFQVFNSTPLGPVSSRPLGITSDHRNRGLSFAQHSTQSPSQHGDDPWLRFM